MRVRLDDTDCDVDARSIAQAVAAGAAIAEERGRLVVEVHVDGHRLDDEEIDGIAERDDAAGDVQLITAEPAELVDAVLADSIDALGEADSLQQRAAELIQAGRADEAFEPLGEAIAIWQAVQAGLQMSGGVIDLDLETYQIGETTGIDLVEALATQLESLRAALADKDPVGTADTLLYELPGLAAGWRELLGAIRARLE